MKKFTRFFLLGERSVGLLLRKIGLSLVVLFFAFAAFADDPPEAQSTLEVWAKNASVCYMGHEAEYEVEITMKDFIKINKLDLKLKFNSSNFNYEGMTVENDVLSSMTAVESTAGTISFAWTAPGDTMATIDESDNAAGGVPVATLHFSLKGTPFFYSANSVNTLNNNLVWDVTNYKNTAAQDWIKTFADYDGILAVSQKWPTLEVDVTAADCYGSMATVTVTSPANVTGMEYSWNGDSFTDEPSTNVDSPSENQMVVIRDDEGCVSYNYVFDVEGPDSVKFVTDEVVYTNCPEGNGDIEIFASGGSGGYNYFVVPVASWSKTMTAGQLATFDSPINIFQKPVGTYMVAVQDKNDCVDLTKNYEWQMVEVIDTLKAFESVVTFTDATCNNNDGRFTVTLTGGSPFDSGYNIYVNNQIQSSKATSVTSSNLTTGVYTVMFQDANGCTHTDTVKIGRPEPITFDLTWEDTGCQESEGNITVSNVKGGNGSYTIQYTTVLPWATATTYNGVGLVADNLAAGIYYVRVMDGNGCVGYWSNAQGDDAVKILDTNFDITVAPIACYGEATTVNISVITGSGNHEMLFSNDGTTWVEEGEFDVEPFTALDTVLTFWAMDVTADSCIVPFSLEVEQPAPLTAYIVPYLTLPPTCPDGTDGRLTIEVSGGTANDGKYFFQIDEGNFVERDALFTYFVDNKPHTVVVKDANDCEVTLEFDFPDFKNKISFQDTIWTSCPMDKVNLFNGTPETCEATAFGVCIDGIDMDNAYFNIWESQWHGIPLEHFLGGDLSNWEEYLPFVKAYLVSLGMAEFDVDAVIAEVMTWGDLEQLPALLEDLNIEVYGIEDITEASVEQMIQWVSNMNFVYTYWTSDEGWKYVVTQGIQHLRNPLLYYSATATTPDAIYAEGQLVNHTTSFGAGTYYVVARDEFGCYSNVEKIVVLEPARLEVTLTEEAAGCFGSIDGGITITAGYGSDDEIPGTPFEDPTLQYAVVNNPAIFNVPNWYTQVTWHPLSSESYTFTAGAGTYYIAVRDLCAVKHPELIVVNSITVDGAEELLVDANAVIVKNVTCNVYGAKDGPSNDGHILVPSTAVTGGFGNYTYTLDLVSNYEASLKSASIEDRFPETNDDGVFVNLAAGTYTLTVTDDHGCYTVEEFEVTQPDAFRLETAVAYPSCFNEHDGFIRYMIYGGTGPFQETTNNVGEFENVNLIPENRWVSVENGEEFHDFLAFDRRVRNGHYEIYVRDANGCVYGPVKVQVLQPAQLGATTSATAVSCVSQNGSINPVVNDGTITVMPSGGWNKAGDGYVYTIQLRQGATVKGTVTQDVAASYTFTGLTAGNYTVTIVEKNASLPWQLPIIASDPDYFAKFHDYASQLPWQNPDANCFYTSPVITVGQPEPIDYDIEFNSVVCRNTATGSIELTNVTGGTAPYWFAISGPVGSGYEANPLTTVGYQWKPLLGDDEYTWTGLIHGHYNIYLKDANGCTIFRESGEVNNVDSLTVNMKLNENAQCFEGNGEIEVIAGGGVGGYKYAVSSNTYNFNTLGESGLVWQDSPVFEKPAGVWVGYVKDANGCIQGGPTTKTGVVIQNHRVTILQPAKVVASSLTSTAALCYDDASGKINVTGIAGGNGGKYSARVTGNDFSGAAVDKFYTAANVSDVALTLTGLKASTSKAPTATLTNADKYQVVVYDSEGCESDVYYVAVHQPEEFEIIIRAKQDAFICSDDKAGLFEIIVARGGTPFSYDTNNKGIYEYKWEAYTEAGVKVDSLTGNWGFTSSFLGYADIHYYVTARDKNGCIAEADTLVNAPAPVVIEEIKDISCYGDANATARVTVSGEEGRTFQVRTLRFAGSEEYLPWSAWSESFESSIELNSLTYGNESEKEGHYKFQVRDNMGCLSEIETMTFVPVQHELAIVVTSVAGECTGEVTALVNGGIAPYDVYANGELLMSGVAANTSVAGMIASGTYELRVVDAHECELVQEVTVASNPVVVNETFEVFVGEEKQYVNAEYGVDSLLNASDSPYTFTYTTEEGCVRTLVVTVVEVVRQVAIADIQGDSWASPVVGATRGITGTVTGVVPGVGYFVQDAVAPWSGIWVVDATTVVLEGNGVHVEGVVAEINEVTSLVGVGTVVNPPLAITPISVDSPSAAEAEMYESVLVKVSGARATAVNPDGSWSVYYEEDDNVVVDKLIFEYEPVAGHFYDVTGIVFGALDVFKLEPRKLADIRDITATTDVNIIEGVSFKVYPNPFNNELNIDNHDKLVRATITNIAGQRVMDVQYPERVIRTANLVSGVYVVTLFTEDGIVKSERIVKR